MVCSIPDNIYQLFLISEASQPTYASDCTVDFDPVAGNKVKGINHAILAVEPHPFNAEEVIIVVSTSSGEATIWHLTDPRCPSVRGHTAATVNCTLIVIDQGGICEQAGAEAARQI